MSDQASLSAPAQGEERDQVPELPVGLSAHPSAANLHSYRSNESLHSTIEVVHHTPAGNTPAGSHPNVNLTMFDPAGVNGLSRTLSHISLPPDTTTAPGAKSMESVSSHGTAVGEAFDLEKVLKGLLRKGDEAGLPKRELGVSFEDLRVVGLGAAATYQPTLASMLNPLNALRKINRARHPALRDILSGFYGVVRPGEMLLVLGRPGAGCSTLLRTLANQRDEYYAIEGEVHYDSFTSEEIHKSYRGDVQYSPEDDVHFPTLTVGQTLNFAAKTRTPHSRISGHSRDDFVKLTTDIVTTVFGLRHVRDTLVGDAAVRGVSGGEKKRVSISEALATRSVINSWDNSTRGLDSSTALEFVQALRMATEIARSTTIVSIYQAGESLYKLFDKVCVINQGKMAYFGRADQARQYFIDLGYEPANRQTTADFLVSVTDPLGRTARPGFEQRVPRTAAEFAARYDASPFARWNREDIAAYKREAVGNPQRASTYRDSVIKEHVRTARATSAYITSIPMQARALMTRRVQILRGGIALQVVNIAVFIVQAIIIGTVFVRLPDSTLTYFSRGGVIFFALLFAALTAQAEIPALFAQRPIVLRQSRAAMYYPFIESLALTLVDMPIAFITLLMFSIVLYFIVGLQQTASQFFIFLLFVYTMTITMRSWFRLLAAAFKTPAPAQTVAGLAILILVLYTGYAIPQPSMIGALRWITYVNPIRYGFEGLLVNEFHTLDGQCASLIPSGPGYEGISIDNQVCTTLGSLPAQATVDGNRYVLLSFGYEYAHLWRNFGIVVAYGIGFTLLYLLGTQVNTRSSAESAVTLYRRGSNVDVEHETGNDEEKAASPEIGAMQEKEVEHAMKESPAMSDIFSWYHLRYDVPVGHGKTRRLLDDVSGYVAPGKLTALMGESGAGKTTLLNVLAQRTSIGVVTGDRFVNGHAPPPDFQAQTGYCQQMDTHLPSTTVREALLFSARMRQPESVPYAEKAAYVEKCLKMCGLEAHAEAVVGSLGVEHRKRTTIGVELAAKPRLLLFLDEPTSGLDSQSAWAIMSFLRKLADSGLSILCTIHQPSAELFQVFDRLLLLRKGGQTVYFGDIGPNSSTLISYFERNGAVKCGPDENPAEYILTSIGAGATATSEFDWYEKWSNSKEADGLQQELEQIHAEGHSRGAVGATYKSEFATPWMYQVGQLLRRDCLAHWRDPTYLLAKLALNIIAGLFIGFTFFKSKDTLQGTQNKLFAVFMSTIISVPLTNQLQVSFINMRNVYEIRERPSRMYSWTALVTSQILSEVPWNIFGASLFFVCWFWTVGFPTSRGGYTFLFYSIVNPIYYTTIGQAVAAMSPNTEIAAILFSFLFSFVITFNGVLQPFRELGWWRWMYRLSPYTYLIEGLVGQAFGRQTVNCADVELVQVNPPSGKTCGAYLDPFISNAGGYITNPDASEACLYCSFRTTDQFLLNSFNIEWGHRWRNFGFMFAFIAFNIFAIYAFTYIFRINKTNPFKLLSARLRRNRS
ncbi:uncharacterized protein PHACADRAFT_259626 [Phanerochaete carnosa HHB-10118-sp]|uniref:ABC transporter domain-containing protein n=1 Tax=Phanerochaete carnosa (strain HHB-10118-sp) TaxID=650164 RepID=K5WSH7_PHACS|nr:uncharacterized protein PHACADRAFT_259626 [Phanerochaete carnosa HHB-10118-sp]EKM53332.1 hypothetical protein PHACADRAFT_259626 [Phanerochaete carnosa HHB-10118-sp]